MNAYSRFLPFLQEYINKEFKAGNQLDGDIYCLNSRGLISKLLHTPCCNRSRLYRKSANYYLEYYDLDLEAIRAELYLIYCQIVTTLKEKKIKNVKKYLFKSLNNYLRTHFTTLCKERKRVPEKYRNKFMTVDKKGEEVMVPQAKYLKPDLSNLCPDQRFVVDSYFLQGFSIRKISELLDKSERTILRLKTEGLNALHREAVK